MKEKMQLQKIVTLHFILATVLLMLPLTNHIEEECILYNERYLKIKYPMKIYHTLFYLPG